MKNSNDTIVNRTRDLLGCSAVPQPTALWYAPIPGVVLYLINTVLNLIIVLKNLSELEDKHYIQQV